MKSSFRWYGSSDPVRLQMIRQIPGVRHIVSANYSVKPGEVWSKEDIKRLCDMCRENGLIFDVVESLPVTDAIKLGSPKRERHIENYITSIKNLAGEGINCITYNFMPVFDWTRTTLYRPAEDGSTSLFLSQEELNKTDPRDKDLTLPGWDSAYKRSEMLALMEEYRALTSEELFKNLVYFLRCILPAAREYGVKMAIHPDDPPYPIFSLPRIISDEGSIDRLFSAVPDEHNTLCFCTGSLGCHPKNDIPKMVRKYSKAGRISFIHLRNVKILPDNSFYETAHLSQSGSIDMNAVVKALCETGFEGYFRPDHGRMIWGEQGKPGYGLYDRALGSAYINGLIEANGGSIE